MSLVSSTIFNTIYKYTVNITPAFTFFVMAGMAGVPLVLGIVLRSVSPREQYNDDLIENEKDTPVDQQVTVATNPMYDQIE